MARTLDDIALAWRSKRTISAEEAYAAAVEVGRVLGPMPSRGSDPFAKNPSLNSYATLEELVLAGILTVSDVEFLGRAVREGRQASAA